jgi:hypothetical protein
MTGESPEAAWFCLFNRTKREFRSQRLRIRDPGHRFVRTVSTLFDSLHISSNELKCELLPFARFLDWCVEILVCESGTASPRVDPDIDTVVSQP